MSLPVAILCGGMGTRIYPLTLRRPKVLIELLGEPFIAHQLRLLKKAEIEEAVLCVAHQGESVQHYVGDGRRFGIKVKYSFDGPVLLGTAGALRCALPLLGEEFFVLYGDSYLCCDYQAVERRFREAGKQGLMTVFRNDGQWDSSNVEMSNEGTILAYDKKNRTLRMRYIDYGLGILRASAFDGIKENEHLDLATLYQRLLAAAELSAYEVNQRFYEVGSFRGIAELTDLLGRKEKP